MNTASKYVKHHGLRSLRYVSDISTVPVKTLHNWWNHDRVKFQTIVDGVLYKRLSTKSDRMGGYQPVSILGYTPEPPPRD